jgi:hypothetical protein
MAYTQFNILAIYIWHIHGHSHYFASILWCNSISIQTSYEIVRYINPITYNNFVIQFPYHIDKIVHILPFIILYSFKEPWEISHSLISLSSHLLWASMNRFDINQIYNLHPKLTKKQMTMIWIIAICGHLLPAII